jgi:hypothetical protein
MIDLSLVFLGLSNEVELGKKGIVDGIHYHRVPESKIINPGDQAT